MEAYYPQGRLKKRWMILIALLLNILLLLFLFILVRDQKSDLLVPSLQHDAPVVFDTPPPPQQDKDEFDENEFDIAALKPRASVFGATQEEQEDPEFTKGATDSDSQADDGSGLDVAYDHEKPPGQDLEQNTEEIPNNAETKESEINNQQTIIQNTSLQEKAAMSNAAQKALQRMIQKPTKTATKHNTGRGTKNASPIKKQLTFSDLARGFIESFDNEGEDWLRRDGNPNIRPHQKEMKYLSYFRKLAWHVQSTIKQHKVTPQPNWPSELETVLFIQFTRTGDIGSCKIGKSSNIFDYDYLCLQVFENNNSGYPPIPQHIPEDTITIPVSISLSTRRPRIRFSYL